MLVHCACLLHAIRCACLLRLFMKSDAHTILGAEESALGPEGAPEGRVKGRGGDSDMKKESMRISSAGLLRASLRASLRALLRARVGAHLLGTPPGAPPGALAGIVFFVFCKLSKTCHSISCFRRQNIPQQFYLLASNASHSIVMTSQDSWASSLVTKAFGFCQRK